MVVLLVEVKNFVMTQSMKANYFAFKLIIIIIHITIDDIIVTITIMSKVIAATIITKLSMLILITFPFTPILKAIIIRIALSFISYK